SYRLFDIGRDDEGIDEVLDAEGAVDVRGPVITDLQQFTAVDEATGRCEVRGQGSHGHGTPGARNRYDHLGAGGPVPIPEHLEAPLADLHRHLGIRRIGGEDGRQDVTLPVVGQMRDRLLVYGELLGRDPAFERHADVGKSAGPGAARFDG